MPSYEAFKKSEYGLRALLELTLAHGKLTLQLHQNVYLLYRFFRERTLP
jgi:hypothetical protein